MENSLTTEKSLKTNFSEASENRFDWDRWGPVILKALEFLIKVLPLIFETQSREKGTVAANPSAAPALAAA